MRLPVKSDDMTYDIILENGALKEVDRYFDLNRKVLLVTDDGVPEEYVRIVADAAKDVRILRLPAGEQSKTLATYEKILTDLLEWSFTRGDCVVAVGGGVIGDMAGFAAATYMRGIDFYNIPTTLLSQLDSSVGGKTAVNLRHVKNAVGAFYPPKKVLIDPETLKSLPERQFRSGFAEGLKTAIVGDKDLFEILEEEDPFDPDVLYELIERCLKVKIFFVEQDPRERNLRKALNFGHTIGHAIESTEDGKLLHGECIALGMLPMCSPEIEDRTREILIKAGLPTYYDVDEEAIRNFIRHDKKSVGDRIRAVVTEELGTFRFRNMTEDELIARAMTLRE